MIRVWVDRFRPQIVTQVRRDRPPAGNKWNIDEMMIAIGSKSQWLWRAVDDRGDVLDVLFQKRRSPEGA